MWNKPMVAALVAGMGGALVWALCLSTTGKTEPWDADGSYFIGRLLIAGLMAGVIAPYALWAHYCGGFAGQLIYMLVFLPIGPLFFVGIVMLAFYTLWLVGGSFVGIRLRKAFVSGRTPN